MSPRGPFGAVTIHRFGEAALAENRNPNLAEAIRTLGFFQRYGVGIPIAKNQLALAATGHPGP